MSLRRVRCSLRMGIAMIELAALRYRIYKTGMKPALFCDFHAVDAAELGLVFCDQL